MFNMKKMAEKADTQMPYPKQLADKRKEFNQSEPSEGNTELQLEAKSHKDKETAIPFNKQLEAARTGTSNGVTEKQLNLNPKLYNDKRDDRTHDKKITAPALVAEALSQERVEAFNKAQKGKDRDTEFWDKYVGDQLIGEKTKIVSNDQKSQLQNQESRFKGLNPDLKTEKKFNEMVMASLSQADKLLFHIFATAAYENRKITAQEQQKITDINSGKAHILALAHRVLRANELETFIKTAQLDLGMEQPQESLDLGNPAGPETQQPNLETPQAQDYNQEESLEGSQYYTIDPSEKGYTLFKHEKDIATGADSAHPIESFPTEEEAHEYASKAPELDGYEFKNDEGMGFGQEPTQEPVAKPAMIPPSGAAMPSMM